MRASTLPVLAGLAIAALAAACGDQPPSSTATAPTAPLAAPTDATPVATKLDEQLYDHFGAGIAAATEPTELADVLKSPDQFTDKTVAIRAPISQVCPKKGCWMKLGTPAPAVHVTFKDYGFFVPLDAGGRTAIVEGTLAKKDDKLAFVATGVAIAKAPAK